jgi:peptidoglycan-N-acetylglucosamine deacetylase
MFTFRKATLLFFILLFLLNFLRFLGCRMGWVSDDFCMHYTVWLLILITLYLGISIAMAFVIRSGYHHKAFCRRKTSHKVCALSFDDGPDAQNTPQILDILNKAEVEATFFLIGYKIAGNEQLLKRMDAEGHIIGNHGWSHHPLFDFYRAPRMKREFERTGEVIESVIGRKPNLLRPPFGVINPMVSRAVRKLGVDVIGWDVRSYDTMTKDTKRVVKRVLSKTKPGSVILLHDHLKNAPEILEGILDGLKKQSFRIIPLLELFDIEAYNKKTS